MISFLVLFPMLMSFVGWFIGKQSESAFYKLSLITTVIEFALAVACAFFPNDYVEIGVLVDQGLRLEIDGFRKVYTIILSFMWMLTMALSLDYFKGHHHLRRYFFFTLMTLSSTMGVFLAGNLYTCFVFFEIMSFCSFPWVIQEETDEAIKAANTYLAIAVIGGMVALMGIFLFQYKLGTTEIRELFVKAAACTDKKTMYIAGGCVLFGFGAKAGMFPLHIWLPKAHPVAPAPASALLSGALTKSGIFGILVLSCNVFLYDVSWGYVILTLGTITMFMGALLALFSNNLKRTLACSSMSQIGFILIGIGMMGLLEMENALAGYGTLLHMVNHSLFKLVLFMCAGVVYMNTHELELNKIRGFGKDKPLLHAAFLLGAAGIAGIPGLNGYISKTLLHESIVEGSAIFGWPLTLVEWIFLISGGLTLAYMTKLYVCIFIEKPEGEFHHQRKPYMNKLSTTALSLAAATLPILGLGAPVLMNKIAEIGTDFFNSAELEHAIHYYSLENLKGAVISVAIGAAVYFLVVRKWMIKDNRYVDRWDPRLDLEELVYRPLLLKSLPAVFGSIASIITTVSDSTTNRLGRMNVTGTITHAMSDVTDGMVFVLRQTIYRDAALPNDSSVTQSFSYKTGAAVDKLLSLRKKKPKDSERYAKLFYRIAYTSRKTFHNLTDSLSFALLMLCIAISAILLYVLFVRN